MIISSADPIGTGYNERMKSALETMFHICLVGNVIIAFAAILLVSFLALSIWLSSPGEGWMRAFHLRMPRFLTDERGRQINKYLNAAFLAFVVNLVFMFLLGLIIRLV
jgi:hypothetical protein